jgi:hypothetical protein
MLLIRLIDLYSLIIVAAVVVSWINVPRDHQAVRLLHRLTEPVLAPIRKALPPLRDMRRLSWRWTPTAGNAGEHLHKLAVSTRVVAPAAKPGYPATRTLPLHLGVGGAN